ncbi:secreted trypsin-like serine protease [Saccharopolyspora lacisalsi]|uniref:Secreted trypsin-like serine protease n=1 Tax=Halosaccharopolyspora lacisalsi TaxID=1000566 RepID=A0A839DRF4_9PSEU|nr:serine protease [Halosaccharopolyspora lacisalsi]MBA8823299.1 secreted trypsin-like serine protease [Halosaccharopolyspora lacisalsi]
MRQSLRRMRGVTGLLAVATLGSALLATSANASGPEAPPSTLASAPIVGGQPAQIERHPWAVYLVDEQGRQFCGGTLGSSNKVITAAHCVQGNTSPRAIRVVAGREDKRTDAGTVADVTGTWVHPRFESPFQGADVAVLTLDRKVSQRALPIATRKDRRLYESGTRATALGWGATVEGGAASTILRKAELPVVSDKGCSQAYPQRYSARSMVCAGYRQGGVDSCQGDSGGPLVADGKLIGIVSWGQGCGRPGNPGVYTRVLTYTDEISRQLDSSATAA